MEQYLFDDWKVYESEKYLKSEEDILSYFGYLNEDLFERTDVYDVADKAVVICKIGEQFYRVTITAKVDRQEVGPGRKFWYVYDIDSVTYEKIEKPLPKKRRVMTLTFVVTDEEASKLRRLLGDNDIKYCKE